MNLNIFYSWQSDSIAKFNKNFQLDCLKNAIKKINAECNLKESMREDHDTKGILGTPDIASTIFNKIKNSDVFIADLTFAAKTKKRHFSNPNVLIELGYALGTIGDSRVVNIINTAYGYPEGNLPFDLSHKRWPITYHLSEDNIKDNSKVKEQLTNKLYQILKLYVNQKNIKGIDFKNSSEKVQHILKLKKEFEENIDSNTNAMIIRDVDRFDMYPELDDTSKGISPWMKLEYIKSYNAGIEFVSGIEYLVFDKYDNPSRANHNDEDAVKVFLIHRIPYKYIELFEWDGDEYYNVPQVYCHFSGKNNSPYEKLYYGEKRSIGNDKFIFHEVATYDSVDKN